jgi:hypothetical protein
MLRHGLHRDPATRMREWRRRANFLRSDAASSSSYLPPVPLPVPPPVPLLVPPLELPVPPPSLPDVPLDEPDVPLVDPLDDPVPAVPAPLVPAPVVPAPVVPPPVPLPLSLLPPPLLGLVDGRVPAAGGTVDNPEFVLLGLWLRTQSARAVPVSPAHAALGELLLSVLLLFVSVDVDAPNDVDGAVIVDVPDVDDCPSAALAATNDVARTIVLNCQSFIDPPNTAAP